MWAYARSDQNLEAGTLGEVDTPARAVPGATATHPKEAQAGVNPMGVEAGVSPTEAEAGVSLMEVEAGVSLTEVEAGVSPTEVEAGVKALAPTTSGTSPVSPRPI